MWGAGNVQKDMVRRGSPPLGGVGSYWGGGEGYGELETGECLEGVVRTITVNRYERDPKARKACRLYHGYTCYACDADLTKTYGDELGRRAIHVHHVIPMATRGKEYQLDPVKDLVPLCPNCHNVIHKTDPVKIPDEFRKSLGK